MGKSKRQEQRRELEEAKEAKASDKTGERGKRKAGVKLTDVEALNGLKAALPASVEVAPVEKERVDKAKIRNSDYYQVLLELYSEKKYLKNFPNDSQESAKKKFLEGVEQMKEEGMGKNIGNNKDEDRMASNAASIFLEDIQAGKIVLPSQDVSEAQRSASEEKKETKEKITVQAGDVYNLKVEKVTERRALEVRAPDGLPIRFKGEFFPRWRWQAGEEYMVKIIKDHVSYKSRQTIYYCHEGELIRPVVEKGELVFAKLSPAKRKGSYAARLNDSRLIFIDRLPESVVIEPEKEYEIKIIKIANEKYKHHLGRLVTPEEKQAEEELAKKVGQLRQEGYKKEQEIEKFKQQWKHFIVRGTMKDGQAGPPTNLDCQASLFFFKKVFGFPPEFTDHPSYVRPGEMIDGSYNIDTSGESVSEDYRNGWNITADGQGTIIVDHHGIHAQRNLSAFSILYKFYKAEGVVDFLVRDPKEKLALERLSQFTDSIDNYLPLSSGFDWQKAWQNSHRKIFGLALCQQNYIEVEKLYEFFKENDLRQVNQSLSDEELTKYGFGAMIEKKIKEKDGTERIEKKHLWGMQASLQEAGDRLLNKVEKEKTFVESPQYGKIAIILDGRLDSGLFAALAHNFDSILTWHPKKNTFYFNVGPYKEGIPFKLKEDLGQGVWVRGSMFFQPGWKNEPLKFTLGQFLEKMGVDTAKLEGKLKEYLEKEKRGETLNPSGTPRPSEMLPASSTPTPSETPRPPEAASAPPEIPVAPASETFPVFATAEASRAFESPAEKAPISTVSELNKRGEKENLSLDNLIKILYWGLSIEEKLKEIKEQLDNLGLSSEEQKKIMDDSKIILINQEYLSKKDLEEGKKEKYNIGEEVNVIKIENSADYIKARGSFREPKKILVKLDGVDKERLEKFPPGQILKVKIVKGQDSKRRKRQTRSGGTEYTQALFAEFINEITSTPETPVPVEKRETEMPSASLTPEIPRAPEAAAVPVEAAREVNVGTAERHFQEVRQKYIESYRDYLKAKQNVSTVKSIYHKFIGLFKKEAVEQTAVRAEEIELKSKMETARQEYFQAKNDYARALYQDKARELAGQGKTAEEIAEALKVFGHDEIFQKLIIGEERALQEACVAEWPVKEKALWRKALEKWMKLPTGIRVAISTAAVAGVVALSGGFAAVGGAGVALFAGERFVRGLSAVLLGKGAGVAVEKMMGRRIEKGAAARVEEISAEFSQLMREENFTALDGLSEEYHQTFEEKCKKEKNKLLVKALASIAVGVGASYGLGMLAGHYTASAPVETAGGAKSAEEIARLSETKAQAGLAEISKKMEEIVSRAKANNENLIEVLRQKTEAALAAVKESYEPGWREALATLHKGEGVIAVLRRQLEADPTHFGFSGDIHNPQAVHAWANQQAEDISIKEGYWNPAKGEQKWFAFDEHKPTRLVLEGDTKHGFDVKETGGAKSFIHTDNKMPPGLSEAEKQTWASQHSRLSWDENWEGRKIIGTEYWRQNLEKLVVKYPNDYAAGGLKVPPRGASLEDVQKAYENWYNYRVKHDLPRPEELTGAETSVQSKAPPLAEVSATEIAPRRVEEALLVKPAAPAAPAAPAEIIKVPVIPDYWVGNMFEPRVKQIEGVNYYLQRGMNDKGDLMELIYDVQGNRVGFLGADNHFHLHEPPKGWLYGSPEHINVPKPEQPIPQPAAETPVEAIQPPSEIQVGESLIKFAMEEGKLKANISGLEDLVRAYQTDANFHKDLWFKKDFNPYQAISNIGKSVLPDRLANVEVMTSALQHTNEVPADSEAAKALRQAVQLTLRNISRLAGKNPREIFSSEVFDEFLK